MKRMLAKIEKVFIEDGKERVACLLRRITIEEKYNSKIKNECERIIASNDIATVTSGFKKLYELIDQQDAELKKWRDAEKRDDLKAN